jgi:flagellar hook-associated protein 2
VIGGFGMPVGSIGGTYGLSGSGMDIDTIVKGLMTRQQAKADALLQKKTVLEWQKTAYNTVYDDINNFRTSVFNYKLQSTLSPNKVTSSNTSVVTVTAISDAADVNHSLVVTQLAGGVNLTSSGTITVFGAPDKLNISNQIYGGTAPTGLYKFTIANGGVPKEITIDPAKSINDLVSQINSAGVNVKASYDSTLDRFFMSTTNTGSSAEIKIVNDPANDASWGTDFFVNKLNLPTEVSTTGKKGKDAQFTLDDVPLTQANNNFTISGVTYNLTGVSATPTTISVTNDTDKAVNSIQSLVDSYNKILAGVNGKMNEARYKDFPPLTDAQKSVMKETDITAWETKAKSGMLRNDQTLASLVNTMRNAFSNPVTGSTPPYNSASSIGITTGNYTEGGKLYLDTDKLRTALNANPDVLNQLFGASGTDSQSQGIAGRLYDGIKTKLDQLAKIAGTTAGAQNDTNSSFAKRLTSYNLQISNAADHFDVVQSAYYKKFSAMEVALQQLYSQSSWLSSALSPSS